MPRKPNYGFEKQKKEQDRQRKKEAKLAEKQRKRDEARAEEAQQDQPPAVDPQIP